MTLLKSINIIGSGGHARSVVALLLDAGYGIEGIYDDSYKADETELILGVKLNGKVADLPKDDNEVILAVGNNELREKYFHEYSDERVKESIISSNAIVERAVTIAPSTLVFHHALINAGAKIGSNCIINSKALIEHECVIGDHCHISIASVIGGRVRIGSHCFIGAGAVIKDQIQICDKVIIGAGSVVIKSILEPGTYVGNPLRKIK